MEVNVDSALEFRHVSFCYACADGATEANLSASAEAGMTSGIQPASDMSVASAPVNNPDVIHDCSFSVPRGAFCLLCGSTGAGKSTILRLAKPGMEPAGKQRGEVLVMGRPASSYQIADAARTVAFLGQDPHAQLVCDSVWHELAFGLENLGIDANEMRRRVAQLSYFFGLEPLFHEHCASLSDGQAQLVALASVLVLEPELLLLDEPTSMLDPLTRANFAHALFRLNRELGITIVLATHEPWTLSDYATAAFEVKDGQLTPIELKQIQKPVPLDGEFGAGQPRVTNRGEVKASGRLNGPTVALQGAWLRYGREDPWVLRGVDLALTSGEVHALLGANGSGKSTVLKACAGLVPLSRGVLTNPNTVAKRSLFGRGYGRGFDRAASDSLEQNGLSTQEGKASIAYLPQRPELLFGGASVGEEICACAQHSEHAHVRAIELSERFGLTALFDQDPLDLSRGQRQLVALAKTLAPAPRLLLADEPTVGLDWAMRKKVVIALRELAQTGSTILLSTHDMALAQELACRCSLLFDGEIACTMPCDEFFSRSLFFRDEHR